MNNPSINMNDTPIKSGIDPTTDRTTDPHVSNVRGRRKRDLSRDWNAINRCRALIRRRGPQLLAELLDGAGLPEPTPNKREAPPISDRDILVAAAIRAWEGRTAGEAEVAILAASVLLFLRFETGFAADSTGFGSSNYDHYFADKLRRKPTKRRSRRTASNSARRS